MRRGQHLSFGDFSRRWKLFEDFVKGEVLRKSEFIAYGREFGIAFSNGLWQAYRRNNIIRVGTRRSVYMLMHGAVEDAYKAFSECIQTRSEYNSTRRIKSLASKEAKRQTLWGDPFHWVYSCTYEGLDVKYI